MNNRYSEQWWKDYEKDWLMQRWSRDLEDEMGLVIWAVAVLLGSCVLWILTDLTLSILR